MECFRTWNSHGLFSFFVAFDGLLVPFHQFIGQGLGLQDLYPFSTREQLGLEVGGGFQVEFKVKKKPAGIKIIFEVTQEYMNQMMEKAASKEEQS